MKKFACVLAALLCLLLVPAFGAAFAQDGTAEKRLVLDSCDYNRNWVTSYTGMDDSNYLMGKGSVSVRSNWPNSTLYIDSYTESNGKTNIENSGIAFEDAWFDFFMYVDNAEGLERVGTFKLSADKRKDGNLDTPGTSDDYETPNEPNAFIFFMANIKLHSGWNYVCLKLSDAFFTGEPEAREEVYFNLKKFVFEDRAGYREDTPEGETGDEWRNMIVVNVDEVTITDTPRTLTPDLLTAKSIPRNSETYYTNGVYYTEPASISVLFLVSGCLFFAAVLVTLGATLFLHPKKKGNGAAAAALLVFALGGAVFAGAFPSLPSAEAASVSSDFDITCDYAYDAAAILDTEVKMEGYGSYRMDIYPADWCVGGNFGNIVITANPPKDTTLTNENAAVTGYIWIDSKADIVDTWSDSLNIKMSRYYNGQPVIGGSAQSNIMTRKLDFDSLQENSWNFFAIPLSEFTQVNPAEPFVLDELKFFSIGVGANTSDTNIRIDAIKFVDKNVPGNMEEPTGDNAYSTSDTLVGHGGTVVYHGDPFIPENVDPAVTDDTVVEYPYGAKQALSVAATAVSGVLFVGAVAYASWLFLKKRRAGKNSGEGRTAQ